MHNNNEALTEPQMTELCALIQRQIDRHQKPDNIESKLIDEDNKNLYFMWGKIKRRYPVNDTFAWPSKEAAKICGCSKTDVGPIMARLEKLGAITRIQMVKIIIISIFAIAIVMFAMRLMPKLRFFIQRLLQNPFVRAILFRGLWRLIRLLIFRR